MHFTVEEENLICMYHNADRRRTMGKITAALPDIWTGICGHWPSRPFLSWNV